MFKVVQTRGLKHSKAVKLKNISRNILLSHPTITKVTKNTKNVKILFLEKKNKIKNKNAHAGDRTRDLRNGSQAT